MTIRTRGDLVAAIEQFKAAGLSTYQAMSAVLDNHEWEMLYGLLEGEAYVDAVNDADGEHADRKEG